MPDHISAEKATENVRKVLADVINEGVTYTIFDVKTPVAVIMPYEDYQRLKAAR